MGAALLALLCLSQSEKHSAAGAREVPVECAHPRIRARFASLLDGIEQLDKQSTATLGARGFVASTVRRIGLTPTGMTWKNQSSGESKSIYGDEAAYKLPAGYSMQTGLWQIPQQFECALTHLRELRPDSLLTIGTWSGWTDLFLNAYLSRFSRAAASARAHGTSGMPRSAQGAVGFTHVTFDIRPYVEPCVGALLRARNARTVVFGAPALVSGRPSGERATLEPLRKRRRPPVCQPAPAPGAASAPAPAAAALSAATSTAAGCALPQWLASGGLPDAPALATYDVCFIDGDHDYAPARLDFESLKSRCRAVMFHDIVNKRVGFHNVPRLWLELKAGAQPANVTFDTVGDAVGGTAGAPVGAAADLGGHAGAYVYTAHECVYQPVGSDGRMMGIGILKVLSPLPAAAARRDS